MTPKASRGSRAIPTQSQVRLSAIVAARDGAAAASLELCLTSLLTDQSVDEVVIVDSGAPAALASALRALAADRRDVRLVSLKDEPAAELSRALNVGAAAALGRWLLFVDPNVVVQPGAVDRLLKAGRLARAPAAVGGAVGPRRSAKSRRRRASSRAVPVDMLSGELLLIGRQDFEAVQGFEPGCSSGPFSGLSRRLSAAGGEVLLQPNAEGVQMRRARGALEAIAAWWRRLRER